MASFWVKEKKRPHQPSLLEMFNAETDEERERKAQHLATKVWFNASIGFVIFVNAITVGIEVDYGQGDLLSERPWYFAIDVVFCALFFTEMYTRQNQLGWDYFLDAWNAFDYTVVVLNVADLFKAISPEGASGLRIASTVRVMRLLRIVRSMRGLHTFNGLFMLLEGMLQSMRTIAWVGVLFMMIVYCCAVVLTEVAGHNEKVKDNWTSAEMYVGSVSKSMWTIIQVFTFDHWVSDIARPLAEYVGPGVVLLFCVAIIITVFGVINVIIGVMVERTLSLAAESKKMSGVILQKTEQELLSSVAEDFYKADDNGSGELDHEEFLQLIREPSLSRKLRLLGVEIEEAESLFECMDADQSGSISPEEFVVGIQKIKGLAKGQDIVQLISFAQMQCYRAVKFVERLHKLNVRADMIQDRLNKMGRHITVELKERKKASTREEVVWKRAAERQNVMRRLDTDRVVKFPALKRA